MHRKVRQLRHGPDPDEMGGVNIESQAGLNDSKRLYRGVAESTVTGPEAKKFLNHYVEELKQQFRGGTSPKQ